MPFYFPVFVCLLILLPLFFVVFSPFAFAIGSSRREAVKQAMVIDTTENEITSRASKAGTLLCARKQQHKKKKRTSFRSNFGKGNYYYYLWLID